MPHFYSFETSGLFNSHPTVVLRTLAFFAISYAMAGMFPSPRAVMVIGNIMIIPMNIFSGAFLPPGVMSEGMKFSAELLPLTHLMSLLKGLWFTEPFSCLLVEVAILDSNLILSVLIDLVTFR